MGESFRAGVKNYLRGKRRRTVRVKKGLKQQKTATLEPRQERGVPPPSGHPTVRWAGSGPAVRSISQRSVTAWRANRKKKPREENCVYCEGRWHCARRGWRERKQEKKIKRKKKFKKKRKGSSRAAAGSAMVPGRRRQRSRNPRAAPGAAARSQNVGGGGALRRPPGSAAERGRPRGRRAGEGGGGQRPAPKPLLRLYGSFPLSLPVQIFLNLRALTNSLILFREFPPRAPPPLPSGPPPRGARPGPAAPLRSPTAE